MQHLTRLKDLCLAWRFRDEWKFTRHLISAEVNFFRSSGTRKAFYFCSVVHFGPSMTCFTHLSANNERTRAGKKLGSCQRSESQLFDVPNHKDDIKK